MKHGDGRGRAGGAWVNCRRRIRPVGRSISPKGAAQRGSLLLLGTSEFPFFFNNSSAHHWLLQLTSLRHFANLLDSLRNPGHLQPPKEVLLFLIFFNRFRRGGISTRKVADGRYSASRPSPYRQPWSPDSPPGPTDGPDPRPFYNFLRYGRYRGHF